LLLLVVGFDEIPHKSSSMNLSRQTAKYCTKSTSNKRNQVKSSGHDGIKMTDQDDGDDATQSRRWLMGCWTMAQIKMPRWDQAMRRNSIKTLHVGW
jgi:hypothetical protein